MKDNLKQMLNKVTLQGTLMDNTLEIKVDKNNRKYLSGELEVMTDNDYVIPVSVFAYELKNSGEKNAIYERLVKLLDCQSARTVGIQKAPKVAISNARIEDNSFYSERDNRIVNNWRVGASFIRLASTDATNQNSFEVQGIISSIKEVLTKEGEPTDTYQLKLLNVGFGNKVNELTLTFDDPQAISYINNNYGIGDLVTLCGQIIYEQQERTIEKELGFGEPIKQTYTNTVRLLKITAGTQAIDGEEGGYRLKDLQSLIVSQNNDIIERYNARAQMTASTTKAAGASLLF